MHFPSVAWLKSAFRMSEIRIDLNAKLRDVPHKPGVYVMRDRLGHVISTRIVESSGDTAFDAAALDMVKRSDPVPAPPPLIADEGLTFSLPVIFRTKGKG